MMELLALLFTLVVILPIAWLFEAWLLRIIASWIADEDIGWGMAAVTVLVSGIAQSVMMGIFIGGDGGLCGALFGLCIWAGMTAVVNGIRFAKALVIGLCMAIVHWLLMLGLVMALIVLGLGAVAGIAAFA